MHGEQVRLEGQRCLIAVCLLSDWLSCWKPRLGQPLPLRLGLDCSCMWSMSDRNHDITTPNAGLPAQGRQRWTVALGAHAPGPGMMYM